MEKRQVSLNELLDRIVNNGAMAVTVETEAMNRGTIFLTVHPHIGLDFTNIDTVLVEDIPSQVIVEQTCYGIDTLGSTIVYLQSEIDVKSPDGSKISGKSLKEGLKDVKNNFLDLSCERANDQKQRLLDDTRTGVDTSLLYEISQSQSPSEVFYNPMGDVDIEIYTIDGYEYALYTDGGVREAYKCTRVSETLSEQLTESDYWKTEPSPANQASAMA